MIDCNSCQNSQQLVKAAKSVKNSCQIWQTLVIAVKSSCPSWQNFSKLTTACWIISNFVTGSLSSLFYHCYQIWYKDCLKYENRMQLVGPPFLPPPPHHHHWHYFDITKLPYQKQYPTHLLQKPPKVKVLLMSWFQDLWWSSTIFRMNMTESCLFVNWRGVYDKCSSYDWFSSYDVCLAHQMIKS